jgi:hypothetical protein
MTKDNTNISSLGKDWALYPRLDHLAAGPGKEKLELRRRLRKVRYTLFSLKNCVDNSTPLEDANPMPGFIDFWLESKPVYAIAPNGSRTDVALNNQKAIENLGGYASFATVWDVDAELNVFIRHISIWQEWNATLHRVVPIMGDQ